MQFSFTEIETFVLVLGALLGFIVLIYNAVKAIKALTQPMKEISGRLDRVEEKLENDWSALQHQGELYKLLLKGVRQLIIHEIDGNDVKNLENLKERIDEYLIENA